MVKKAKFYPISPLRVKAVRGKILDWYGRNGRHTLPWRMTRDPYRILVAEIMLQQTQVSRVVPKYEAFIRAFPTVERLARAGRPQLLRRWSGLGYNRRVLYLKELAKQVVGKHQGNIPDSVEVLQQLPGLGPYASRAVAIFAFNQDEITIDTNVRRVLIHELNLPPAISASQLEAIARQLLPKGKSRQWHSALMDYGSAVATARTTGVKSLGRQPKFEGSNRYYRGQVVQLLLTYRQLTRSQLARKLGLPNTDLEPILAKMVRDRLVAGRKGSYALAR